MRRSEFSPHSARPVSEILRPGSYASPEAETLNSRYEDLQQYEKNLESIASANLNQSFKEELQHVDQWFRYLSDAEKTATVYTLLQHSSQIQLRFFRSVLQQLIQPDIMKEPVDQMDLPNHLAHLGLRDSPHVPSPLAYAERSAKTALHDRTMGRHSLAVTDMEDRDALFKPLIGTDRLDQTVPSTLASVSSGATAPSSSIAGTTSNYTGNSLLNDASPVSRARMFRAPDLRADMGSSFGSRPRSVIEGNLSNFMSSNWMTPSRSSVGNIGDRKPDERPKSADISSWAITGGLDPLDTSRTGNGFQSPWRFSSNLQFADSEIDFSTWQGTQPIRRQRHRSNIPGTVPETEEQHQRQATQGMASFSNVPESSATGSTARQHMVSPSFDRGFGTFLNPADARNDGEQDSLSDHSNTSHGYLSSGGKPSSREKQHMEEVDMEILKDVPMWFRSLRLHKYTSIFESMKWQDIIKLTDEDLLAKGVAALGARRKMLKIFDTIKVHCDANHIDY